MRLSRTKSSQTALPNAEIIAEVLWHCSFSQSAAHICCHVRKAQQDYQRSTRLQLKEFRLLLPRVTEQRIRSLNCACGLGHRHPENRATDRGEGAALQPRTVAPDQPGPAPARPCRRLCRRGLHPQLTARVAEVRFRRDAISGRSPSNIGMRHDARTETIAATHRALQGGATQRVRVQPDAANIGVHRASPRSSATCLSVPTTWCSHAMTRNCSRFDYFQHLRHTPEVRQSYFELALATAACATRIYYGDLGRFTFLLPPIDVQTRFVRLSGRRMRGDRSAQQDADALRTQKRGLMQKLLTGQWRLSPSKEMPG